MTGVQTCALPIYDELEVYVVGTDHGSKESQEDVALVSR